MSIGYSPEALGRLIAHNIRAGKSHAQAVRIAFQIARREYRRRYPGKQLPPHLRGAPGTRFFSENPQRRKKAKKKKSKRRRAKGEQVTRTKTMTTQVKRVRKNPGASSRQARVEQAARLFRNFRGEDPGHIDTLKVNPTPDVMLTVGECIGIMYRTKRDGQVDNYLHRFAKKSRPTLAVSPDGKNLYLLGGAYRVTDRGIVDDA